MNTTIVDRVWSNIAGLLAGLILVVPILSLVPAAVLDQGPLGEVRFSVFPLVLALYDPLMAASLGQSLIVATVVTLGSVLSGVGIGAQLSRRRFWARPLFQCLLCGLAVLPPGFLTLGALGVGDILESGDSGSLLSSTGAASARFPLGWRWMVWIWSAMIPGSALVLGAAIRELESVPASWLEAARLSGAGRWQVWRGITWPRIRSTILAAAWGPFVMTLVDPGPALILGLRKTLGYQIVTANPGANPFPKIAAVSLIIVAVVLVARTLLGRRLGRFRCATSALDQIGQRVEDGMINSGVSSRGMTLRFTVLCSALLLGWLPVAGLVTMALKSPTRAQSTGMVAVDAPEMHAASALAQSALLAIVVTLAAYVVARGISWERPGRSPSRCRAIVGTISELIPRLIVGVALLSLVRLLGLGSVILAGNDGVTESGEPFPGLARVLDPRNLAAILSVVGTCLAYVPSLLLGNRGVSANPEVEQRRIDQALLIGAGQRTSVGLACAGGRAIRLRTLILCGVIAGTSISPAILLGGTESGWGVGPAVVLLSTGSGDWRRQAAVLALVAMAARLVAWTVDVSVLPTADRRPRMPGV